MDTTVALDVADPFDHLETRLRAALADAAGPVVPFAAVRFDVDACLLHLAVEGAGDPLTLDPRQSAGWTDWLRQVQAARQPAQAAGWPLAALLARRPLAASPAEHWREWLLDRYAAADVINAARSAQGAAPFRFYLGAAPLALHLAWTLDGDGPAFAGGTVALAAAGAGFGPPVPWRAERVYDQPLGGAGWAISVPFPRLDSGPILDPRDLVLRRRVAAVLDSAIRQRTAGALDNARGQLAVHNLFWTAPAAPNSDPVLLGMGTWDVDAARQRGTEVGADY